MLVDYLASLSESPQQPAQQKPLKTFELRERKKLLERTSSSRNSLVVGNLATCTSVLKYISYDIIIALIAI